MSPRRAAITGSNPAGSPPSGEPAFLAVGKLRRPHGVHGEMIMEIMTDFPERLHRGMDLYVGEAHQVQHLSSIRPNGATLLVRFDGFSTPEAAGSFRNQIVYVPTVGRPPLPEGEYYHHQLIGLQVVSDVGKVIGMVHEILETGANDVLVVRPPVGPEILLPAIDPVVLNVDLEKKLILVHLLPGLVEELDNVQDADDEETTGPEPAPGV